VSTHEPATAALDDGVVPIGARVVEGIELRHRRALRKRAPHPGLEISFRDRCVATGATAGFDVTRNIGRARRSYPEGEKKNQTS
jgi:hypothetical protein